jgi:hypothetical protein
MSRISTNQTVDTFKSAFREYGLPDAMRSDNGIPFVSRAVGGLSALNIWWLKLGIILQRGRPGHPTDNARHERMHRTLNEEAKRGRTLAEQQVYFDLFRFEYNTLRPHQALQDLVPADIYVPSVRRYPKKLKDPKYDDEFYQERLGTMGRLHFMGNTDTITPLLGKELIGLRQIELTVWNVYFASQFLGYWDKKGFHPDRHFKAK